MREVRDDIHRWLARGDRVALATVVATRRSAPRPIGAKLAISAGGELAGSVSGGCVENEVYEVAREVLVDGPPRLLSYGISDDLALSVGLPCGGEIDVFVEEVRSPLIERLLQVVESGERAIVLTVLEGPRCRCRGAGHGRWRTRGQRGGRGRGAGTRSSFATDAAASRDGRPQGLRRHLRTTPATLDLRRGRHRRGALPRGAGYRLAAHRRRRASPLRDLGAAAERRRRSLSHGRKRHLPGCSPTTRPRWSS